MINKKIVIAVFVIGASGLMNASLHKTAMSTVILGSYIFLLICSFLDLFGQQASQFAGALAMLAAVYVVLTEFPWDVILKVSHSASVPANPNQESRQPGKT